MASITPIEEVKARVPVDLTDAALQSLIERIESRLTRHYGDPGNDPRTDTYYGLGTNYVTLPRAAASVETVYNGTTVDVEEDTPLDATDWRLYGNTIERLPYGYPWLDAVVVEWTPIDITDEWIEVVIDLVRLRVARTAHRSERFTEWGYSGAQFEDDELDIIRRLGGVVIA